MTQKSPSRLHRTTLLSCIFAYIDNRKKMLNSNTSSTCPRNMVNFSPLTAEIGSGVWGTPAKFNGFRVLAALLHATLVVGVSQSLQHRTKGATYIRQGGHHVGHWSTYSSSFFFLLCFSSLNLSGRRLGVYHTSTHGVALVRI